MVFIFQGHAKHIAFSTRIRNHLGGIDSCKGRSHTAEKCKHEQERSFIHRHILRFQVYKSNILSHKNKEKRMKTSSH